MKRTDALPYVSFGRRLLWSLACDIKEEEAK